jgi:hypothetical protein
MTSKYPNKANVAYATLLSTDPKAIVSEVIQEVNSTKHVSIML